MIDFKYMYQGLCGLARAHRGGAMAGHLGAAVLAGYFFGEDQIDLDDHVVKSVEGELERIIRGEEAIWYNAQKAGVAVPQMFSPFSEEEPDPSQIKTIAAALSENIGRTRQSGHNVIFAAAALRALHDHPEYATPSIVTGVRKLIAQFNGAVAGRGYYGQQRGWIVGNQVKLRADNDFPLYDSAATMIDTVVDELIASGGVRRQGFGGLFHIINHAAGLADISRYGYQEIAAKGLAAHHHHIRLWRSLPDVEDELGKLKRAEHDPRSPQYWSRRDSVQWSGWLTHRIKTLYGFQRLLPQVESADKTRQAEEAFLYLMA